MLVQTYAMDIKISAVINTLNEEANIADCIQHAQQLANEIVVCDMHSTDRTVEIARTLGARVATVDAKLCDFGRLRHLAVLQARYPWVLVIDADERMTPNLATKLKQIASENQVDVVYLSNLYWYFGGWVYHGGFFENNWPRFFRRDAYLSCIRDFDEQVHNDLSVLQEVTNRIVLPKTYYLEHYAYPSIEKYVNKTLGMYARIEAEQYHQAGRRFSRLRLIADPVKEFARRFLRLHGYRDGMRGFILAVLFAGYRFTTWANVWVLEELGQQDERQSCRPDKMP